jgi:hypothetical protein
MENSNRHSGLPPTPPYSKHYTLAEIAYVKSKVKLRGTIPEGLMDFWCAWKKYQEENKS